MSTRSRALAFATLMMVMSVAGSADTPAPHTQDGPAGYSLACALDEQPGLRSCADLPAAAACARESELASRASHEATAMTFVNRSDHSLQIYWLNLHGTRKLYHTLVPRDRFEQKTYIGHNWLVTTHDDHCIGIFKAAPESVAFF